MLQFSSFDTWDFPSTYQAKEALGLVFKEARIKARNELTCLHRDKTGMIHVGHGSSTGFYHLPEFFP